MYENCKLTKKMNSKFKERAWSKICPYLWNNAQLKFYLKEKLDIRSSLETITRNCCCSFSNFMQSINHLASQGHCQIYTNMSYDINIVLDKFRHFYA